MTKRALALGGGGPAVGLSLGALKAFEEKHFRFDVWTCACIGAWVAVTYNQADRGKEFETSYNFFRTVFRPDEEYARFPVASAFAPDWQSMICDSIEFVLNPHNYANLVVPDSIERAAMDLLKFATDPSHWNFANLNNAILNDVMAVNPISRFITSLIYLSSTKGMARIYYPDSDFLSKIRFDRLYDSGKPAIYYNSYNVTDRKMELFTNNRAFEGIYGPITAQTLCACSALPFIETPVVIDGKTYVEGATIDTVNFKKLMENHPDLDEIWVSRILDRKQIRPAENLYDALNNLVTLFAATTGEDDVKLFLHIAEKNYPKVKIFEIEVPYHINYDWNWSNLDHGIQRGYDATMKVMATYPKPSAATQLEDEWQRSSVPWPVFA